MGIVACQCRVAIKAPSRNAFSAIHIIFDSTLWSASWKKHEQGLYAKTFNDVSSTQIGIALFFGYVCVAFSNLIIPSLADNYGFDTMFCLVLRCKFNQQSSENDIFNYYIFSFKLTTVR